MLYDILVNIEKRVDPNLLQVALRPSIKDASEIYKPEHVKTCIIKKNAFLDLCLNTCMNVKK